MTRPPSDSPFGSPTMSDDGCDGEDTASLERELGQFFAAPVPPDLRSRIVARSNGYRRGQAQAQASSHRSPQLIEPIADSHSEEQTMRTIMPAPVPTFPGQSADRPVSIGRRPEPPSRGIRRVGRDSLGLVASLALVVLVAVSAFAVYGGPSGGGEPTQFQGAGPGPATATVGSGQADVRATDPVYGATDDGTEYVRIPWGDCTNVEPMAFDDAMELIVGEAYPFDSYPPLVEIATSSITANALSLWSFTRLPSGGEPDQSVIDAVVQTYSLYLGCQDTYLRRATLLTPKGLVRDAFAMPGPYLTDGRPEGGYLSALWFDGQGRQTNDPDHFGKLSFSYLYDFRLLPNGKVAAFLSDSQVPGQPDALPTFYENAGYVLFAEHDGQWLIDEHF